jgi:hypothetical protein
LKTAAVMESSGSVLIWRGARIVLNPQRLGSANMLRIGTTRAPASRLNFKFGYCQSSRKLDMAAFFGYAAVRLKMP